MGLHFIVFFSVFLSIFIGMHYYVLSRILTGLCVAGSIALGMKLLFLFGAVSFIGSEFLTHRFATYALKPFYVFGNIWLGMLAIGVTVFFIADIARLFVHAPAFRYQATAASIIITILLTGYSLITVARGPRVKEISISSPRLTTSVPVTIVQLTDMHLNLLTAAGWLENVVKKTDALQPDIIVITGDLIENDITKRPDLCALLRQLRAKHGVYAISGNHEYYAGMEVFAAVARETGIIDIDNQTVATGDGIELIGISDNPSDPPYLSTIVQSSTTLAILLSHRPDIFDFARTKGITLQLSGHTHAGQVPPMDAIVQFFFKYPEGLYEKDGATLYTNPGTGWWGPPMRLFSRCTIAKIMLEKE